MRWTRVIPLLLMCASRLWGAEPAWVGFEPSAWFEEQVSFRFVDPGVKVIVNAPMSRHIDPNRATRIIFFATPNGNTAEHTLGCKTTEGMDWHYDIQHIAAQTRRWRQVCENENIILVCVQPEPASWPMWRRNHADNASLIRRIIQDTLDSIPLPAPRITLACHSGGGSFLFGYINGSDELPDTLDRIIFLDANYGYEDAEKHGDKLLKWLGGNPARRLINIAYDDRNIMLDGKKVVSDTGGTYRATYRMVNRFKDDVALERSLLPTSAGKFTRYSALDGRLMLLIHPNPDNIILHTRLVGEMSGYLHALALGTPAENTWGALGESPTYAGFMQPEPYNFRPTADAQAAIPPRPHDAPGGLAFMRSIAGLSMEEREAAILQAVTSGNIPDFLRAFKEVRVTSEDDTHTMTYRVAPDYLAVGSDDDFVRIPMTPMTAQMIADRFGCVLPTRKMVSDIHQQSTVKLEPRPLTEEREAVGTFTRHNSIIEPQREGKPLGELVSGIKKDVVLSNKLLDLPQKVAIFGWHKLDGEPIQPLTTIHIRTYVDYSHGIRLVGRRMNVNGKDLDFSAIAGDPSLKNLVSDEGTLWHTRYVTP